jgi:DNA polymerase V
MTESGNPNFLISSLTLRFPAATNSTPKITKAALWILRKIYKPGIFYQKCGVMMLDTLPDDLLQNDMIGYSDDDPKPQP